MYNRINEKIHIYRGFDLEEYTAPIYRQKFYRTKRRNVKIELKKIYH